MSDVATSNVIVTGGSRGLGLAMARRLAALGYEVVVIARRESDELAAAMAEAKRGDAGAIHFRAFDLADTAGIGSVVRDLRDEFGAFHGLVNNAGLGTSGVLATMQDRQIENLLHLNLLSPFILTKHVVRAMMAGSGGGRIVNIASVAAFTGYSGLSVYGSTKAALVGFTRSLARELGPLGITVNAVAPGFVDTDMTRTMEAGQRDQIARRAALRRLAEPSDVADAVAYLLGDGGRNVTGTVLTIDAGSTA
jgi:3-oxoacyl-[acyl-carrier protein] reductase